MNDEKEKNAIDTSNLDSILPKYDPLKLNGINLAQNYVSAFNTGMNIYQCVNQLQGYIEWLINSVNTVVKTWNDSVDETLSMSIKIVKDTTTQQFNVAWEEKQPVLTEQVNTLTTNKFDEKWEKVQHTLETLENNVSLIKSGTTDYYVLTESKDKNTKKLDYYFKYDTDYLPNAPYYSNNLFIRDLDLEGYIVKKSLLSNNTCKLKNKTTGDLIDYVYFMLDDNVTVTTTKDTQLTYTQIALKYLPYFAKLKTDTPVEGHLYVDACISIILEKTSS